MAHDVFISYATGDKAVADAVCSQLESLHRIRCWIAPRDITPGASWAESIIDALDTAKIMVLIFSSSANGSMQIEREVERAVHKGINIIPLRIENTTPTKTLEYFISAPHWLDALTVPLEQHIEKLAASVKALLAKPVSAPRTIGPLTPADVSPLQAKAPEPATPAGRSKGESPKGSSRSVALVALGVVLAGLAMVVASRLLPSRGVPATTAVSDPAAPGAQPLETPAAPGSSTASSEPVAAPPVAAAPRDPKPAPVAAAPRDPKPAPVAAAPAAVAKAPNLYIDFRNPISEGSIQVSIDGLPRWSAGLAPVVPPGASESSKSTEPQKIFTEGLTIPAGSHKIEVLLLRPDGKTRETKNMDMTLDASAQTLRIRLSRFKRDLQLAAVAGKPESEAGDADAKSSKPDAKDKKTDAKDGK